MKMNTALPSFFLITVLLFSVHSEDSKSSKHLYSYTSPSSSEREPKVFVGLLENKASGSNDFMVPFNRSITRGKQDARRIDSWMGMNSTQSARSKIFQDVYGSLDATESDDDRKQRMEQMKSWMSERDATPAPGFRLSSVMTDINTSDSPRTESLKAGPFLLPPLLNPHMQPVFTRKAEAPKGKLATAESKKTPLTLPMDESIDPVVDSLFSSHNPNKRIPEDVLSDRQDQDLDDPLPHDEQDPQPGGASKTPPCGSHGRFYCSYKEDYPSKIVSEVSKYYKWPLEKLFRDLRQQVMPKLANDNFGGLVCDSITRVVRPGWAKNTNNRWLVVINTEQYQQFVTEVICRNGPSASCNFIPPCYQATCAQRYNTQKLLVIDPWNPYKGPFVSEFLFPSCCICYVPPYPGGERNSASESTRRESKVPYADRLKNTLESTTLKAEL